MTLTTDQFIRRFLSHVLPKGFHRIRHYGLLANGNRAETGETRHTVDPVMVKNFCNCPGTGSMVMRLGDARTDYQGSP